jgi:radical SAM superfamily enzyme YgiQ (UPF0313 family)
MKITFILPAIGKKQGKKYIGTWKMEPLTIALLKALTPPRFETEFFDDRIELIDYDTATDIVAITLETYTALRGYDIAAKFRAKGKKVIFGGYHATLCPDEVIEHGDCVITGNAETVWADALSDCENGALKQRYDGKSGYISSVHPDRSIYANKKYLPVTLVETGRGCNHNCEFCAISAYYCNRYIPRPHEDIIAELKQSKYKYHFLVDDNLTANREHAMGLFEKMKPLKIKWAGQGTLAIAKDPEMLKAMKASGCELILIGFESLDEYNLKQMNKSWEVTLGERDELVENIHKAGMGIYATFVFGFDGDNEQTFDDAIRFAKKHKFYTAAFNHLLPFPGTATYNRLKEENRLLYDKWWLEREYRYGELSFTPANMTHGRMSRLCRDTRRSFAKLPVVLGRGIASMKRNSPVIWQLFWAMNLRLGEEIDQKMNVPLGGHLDELPK